MLDLLRDRRSTDGTSVHRNAAARPGRTVPAVVWIAVASALGLIAVLSIGSGGSNAGAAVVPGTDPDSLEAGGPGGTGSSVAAAGTSDGTAGSASQRARLRKLAGTLAERRAARDTLAASLSGLDAEETATRQAEITTLNEAITRLERSFEQLALRDVDLELLETEPDAPFDWQQETVEIIEPLFDSIKSLTRRPRQVASLRESIAKNERRLATVDRALSTFDGLDERLVAEFGTEAGERVPGDETAELASTGSAPVAALVGEFEARWQTRRESIEQDLVIEQAQLERLLAEGDEVSVFGDVVGGVHAFLAGRGLTLIYAVVAALIAWTLLQLAWRSFSRHLSKEQRRRATWYRLFAYSFKLITGIAMLAAALVVLYVREDVLLMAIAFLLLAGIALSLRNILPRFIDEARLLLNLGAVREGEVVVYAGLPWRVMSLNLQTVLRNPALDGVIRLPLDIVAGLTSRPVPDRGGDPLLFPTRPNDCILLADESFARVLRQTPELVELAVRGGMIKTIPTADFFTQTIVNLSRSEQFGIAVTFGLDYNLQSRALDEVPAALERHVRAAFAASDRADALVDVLVELKAAGDSALDFLIWIGCDSRFAPDFFKLERIAQQACVAASNAEDWNIPFPHMMVHHRRVDEAEGRAANDDERRAA